MGSLIRLTCSATKSRFSTGAGRAGTVWCALSLPTRKLVCMVRYSEGRIGSV